MDYNNPDFGGNWVYLPRVGEEATFDIAEIKSAVAKDERFNFHKRVPVLNENGSQMVDGDGEPIYKDKSLGYHIECSLKNGKILTITGLSAFLQVFKKHNIQDGEEVKISHPAKGEWVVEKISEVPTPEEGGGVEPNRENEPPF